MRFYIDPGTGSMLFAILIGIIGALNYLLKSWFVKLRFIMTGGKKQESVDEEIPLVIFSDDKRYWMVFEPICREMDRRGIDVVYMTASPDDPALDNTYEHVHAEFIGEGNKAFAKLNFLKARLLLSTTPGVDVYQWKRSKDVKYYVHIPHMANDISGYRMFGVDYYDALLLSGSYQEQEIRDLEALRGLPEKEIELVGIPYMDEMLRRLKEAEPLSKTEQKTVLLAPSWGSEAILSKYGGSIIDALLKTDYRIIIRPHPQSFTSEKEMMDKLMAQYPDSERLQWNRDADNFEVLRRSDILISDFSGVIFDFALVYEKPVIYTDAQIDYSVYDQWWLKRPFWTVDILPRLGQRLTTENMDRLEEMIESCLEAPQYAEGRRQACAEAWEHMGEGAVRTVDYLERKLAELADNSQSEKEEEQGALLCG